MDPAASGIEVAVETTVDAVGDVFGRLGGDGGRGRERDGDRDADRSPNGSAVDAAAHSHRVEGLSCGNGGGDGVAKLGLDESDPCDRFVAQAAEQEGNIARLAGDAAGEDDRQRVVLVGKRRVGCHVETDVALGHERRVRAGDVASDVVGMAASGVVHVVELEGLEEVAPAHAAREIGQESDRGTIPRRAWRPEYAVIELEVFAERRLPPAGDGDDGRGTPGSGTLARISSAARRRSRESSTPPRASLCGSRPAGT